MGEDENFIPENHRSSQTRQQRKMHFERPCSIKLLARSEPCLRPASSRSLPESGPAPWNHRVSVWTRLSLDDFAHALVKVTRIDVAPHRTRLVVAPGGRKRLNPEPAPDSCTSWSMSENSWGRAESSRGSYLAAMSSSHRQHGHAGSRFRRILSMSDGSLNWFRLLKVRPKNSRRLRTVCQIYFRMCHDCNYPLTQSVG